MKTGQVYHSYDGLFPWTRASSLSILALLWAAVTYAAEEPKDDKKENKAFVTTGSLDTPRTWVSYVGLGAQFLPEYNSEGKSEGFNQQEFFADVVVDGHFTNDCSPPGNAPVRNKNENIEAEVAELQSEVARLKTELSAPQEERDKKSESTAPQPAKWCVFGSLHTGVRMSMFGAPIARQANTTAPTKFDDVSKALAFAPYVSWSILQGVDSEDGSPGQYAHNLGPIIRAGIISRDAVAADKDTANWFAQVGLQYTYEAYRFRYADKGKTIHMKNGLPQGYAALTYARFEDYANLGRQNRLVFEGAYQVLTTTRLYLGFKANLGKGPDDFGAFLVYYFAPDRLVNIFGIDTNE